MNCDTQAVVLTRRRLFMLPSRPGWLFAAVLLALLLAALNYGNGLVYALTFLLAAIALVSMLYTDRNLLGLRVTSGPCPSVFAGQVARFTVHLINDAATPRYAVLVEQDRRTVARVNIPAHGSTAVVLERRAAQRGWLEGPTFVLATRFPLGILYSWSRTLVPATRCLVYPRPAPPQPWPTLLPEAAPGVAHYQHAGDDFAGVREYATGDSPSHVHWKASARGGGRPWLTKQFADGESARLVFDYEALAGLPVEERLSRLARLVLDAKAAGLEYGLKLPGVEVAPARGEAHCHACLKALALFSAAGDGS